MYLEICFQIQKCHCWTELDLLNKFMKCNFQVQMQNPVAEADTNSAQ